jgi:hypothetical protein
VNVTESDPGEARGRDALRRRTFDAPLRGAVRRRAALLGARLLVPGLLLAACGGDDVTSISTPESEGGLLTPEPVPESRTLSVLAQPDSLDAMCRLIGVSSTRGGRGGRDACAGAVERCQEDVRSWLGSDDGAPALGVPRGDLQELAGCPLTFAQLDACVGDALARSVASYGDSIGCDQPAPPAIDTLALFASPQCLTVVVLCPQLIENLAAD